MYLVFDIGGSNMRIGVSAGGKTLKASEIVPTPLVFENGIAKLQQVASQLTAGEKIERVAGGIAGPLDKEKTILATSPHMGGWIQKPFKKELEKIFGCNVLLENDTAMIGLGEARCGAGAGKSIVAYLGIGTGIGGARIIDGKIDKNVLGFEPGHQIIIPGGNLCNCGGKGHLEAYVGGSYIEKNYQQEAEGLKDDRIWDELAKYLSIGLNNTIVHWSPDIVILGGSVMKSLPLDKVITHLNTQLKIFPQAPQIIKASLGDNAGLYGALVLLSS